MDDESKAKSEKISEEYLAATEYNTADYDYERSTLDCSVLSEFGWSTMQQKNIHRYSIDDDSFRNDFVNESIAKSETSSSVVGGGLMSISPSANMRLMDQASSSTLNPCVSSSSSDQDLVHKSIGSDDQTPSPSTTVQISCKKKGQKRIRQQRFAFVTKSEVDHLEDGYRWRKYGQKAVKNSPYPRSYYRCTNTKCTVKKRVERSCEDPTTVITTYEGQHCHQTAGFPRGSGLSIRESAFGVQMGPQDSQFYYPAMHLPQESSQRSIAPNLQPTSVPGEARDDGRMIVCSEPLQPAAGSKPQFPSDEGLLGDIVSPRPRNNFHP